MPPFGINLANKSKATGAAGPTRPPGTQPTNKRKKPIFADSDSEDDTNLSKSHSGSTQDNITEITTLGGLDDDPTTSPSPAKTNPPPAKRRPIPLSADTKPPATVKPLSKTSIFANDSDSESTPPQETTTYGLNPPSKTKQQPRNDQKEYTNLSALHSSRQHQTSAQSLDPSIYSYDSIYDTLHAKPAPKPAASSSNDPAAPEVPKYMTALLRSAEIRKRDQLRARDRQLAKEREAEGEEFADKEKFVTAAYKAQQAELRRIEEEEKAREAKEEEERRKNGGKGMVGFYREMLARGEEQHAAVVKAAEEAAAAAKQKPQGDGGVEADAGEGEVPGKTEKSEAQLAAELNAKGAHIAVNDDGQVVDKRQLLSAGLNVAPKPKQPPPSASAAGARAGGLASSASRFGANRGADRGAQRARQTEMIAAQLEERARQEQEAEAARQKEIAERSRSQKTQGDVSSARERYLARKKEREAAA
ncbi:splicing regulator NSRP1-like domain-containing protein, partial [Aspergillus saccharolyticus JOP 1030-1]